MHLSLGSKLSSDKGKFKRKNWYVSVGASSRVDDCYTKLRVKVSKDDVLLSVMYHEDSQSQESSEHGNHKHKITCLFKASIKPTFAKFLLRICGSFF